MPTSLFRIICFYEQACPAGFTYLNLESSLCYISGHLHFLYSFLKAQTQGMEAKKSWKEVEFTWQLEPVKIHW